MTVSAKPCKDCKGMLGYSSAAKPRPAPFPGPRCATHHRAHKKATKLKSHDRAVVNIYGIEAGEYERMYQAQDGKCAICRWATGKSRRLAVDHDHATGRVRGLLCSPCNRYLGYVRDNPDAYRRAAAYLSGMSMKYVISLTSAQPPVEEGPRPRRPNRRDPK